MAVGQQILKILETITRYCRTENVRTFVTKTRQWRSATCIQTVVV